MSYFFYFYLVLSAVYCDERKTTTFGNKNILVLLFFRKRSNLWRCECDRRIQGDKDRLLYWLITSFSLDYTTLCYLQDFTLHFCFSAGVLIQRPQWADAPSGRSPWLLDRSDSRHTLTQLTRTLTRHMHISFHYAHDFRSTVWCVLFREISDWLLCQCNICIYLLYFYRYVIIYWHGHIS